MSTNYFINVSPTSTSNKTFEKSISLIESRMSYRPSELASISRHLSESTIEPAKQNYEDIVTCSVCYDVYDSVNHHKLPKILPCQHTYCVECIKNLLHVSRDFCCPQCNFKVENIRDPLDLPTSRIVLTLLEKDSLNYQGYAACPACRQIRNLEVCFECNLPLCVQCIGKHFENWKNGITQSCMNAEANLDSYKQKLDKIGPIVTQNFENCQSAKDDIEEAFRLLFHRLNTEKELLIRSVNDIKEENGKYVSLRKDINGLIASFKLFRESNENFDKKTMMSKIKKCQSYFDQMPKLEREYNNLANLSFKVLEGFDKRQIPDLDFKFSGDLIITELNLDRPNQAPILQRPPSVQQLSSINQLKPQAPPRPVMKENLRNLTTSSQQSRSSNNLNTDQVLLTKWMATTQIKPQSELTVPHAPMLMTSYDNMLFFMDPTSHLSIYEKVFSVELKHKNSVKLNIPNIKSISANNSYIAVCYSGLKKEHLKGALRNFNQSGIVLYKRHVHVVCSIHERVLELGNTDSFKSVNSIAMNDSYLYACDRDLRSIFKFDLSTGNLLLTAQLKNIEPISLSANQSCLCVTDLNSNLYLFDLDNLNEIQSVNLKQIDQTNGFLSTILNQDNLIFVRNSENQIALLDSSLEQKAFFNEIQAKVLSMSFIKDNNNQMLVIGAFNSRQQFKLFGYTV